MNSSEVQCNKIDDNGDGTVDEGVCDTSMPVPQPTSTPSPTPIPITCAIQNVVTSSVSPQYQGAIVQVTASATGCSNPEYKYWIQKQGGSWQVLQDYTSNKNVFWDTSEYEGKYTISVWVRQNGNIAAYDSAKEVQYVITKMVCKNAGLTINPVGAQYIGSLVNLTASSTDCSNPQYRFWILAPGAKSWQMIKDYSSTATVPWNKPVWYAPYQFSVWVRQRGSTDYYEASKMISR